jgi:hypothetical protein
MQVSDMPRCPRWLATRPEMPGQFVHIAHTALRRHLLGRPAQRGVQPRVGTGARRRGRPGQQRPPDLQR